MAKKGNVMSELSITLTDFQSIIDTCNCCALYKKTISQLTVMSETEWNNQPTIFKESYANYSDYKTKTNQYNAAVKTEIKSKLTALKSSVDSLESISQQDKSLWKVQLQQEFDKI